MKTLAGVEIFSTGPQTASDGFSTTYTAEDIDTIISRFNNGRPEYVPVKLGHTSEAFNQLVAQRIGVPDLALHGENGGQDGVISLGRVANLRRVQDKLIADFEVVDKMAEMVHEGFLRDVSVEVVGKPGDWTLTGVAWLGAELPAVKDLNGLAAAAVLREQVREPVLAFKRRAAVVVEDRMTLKDKLAAFFSKSDDEEIKSLFADEEEDEEKPFPPEDSADEEAEEDDEKEMEDGGDAPAVTPIEGEVAAALKAILGLEMTAGGEEILSALRAAVGLPDAATAEDVVPMMKEKIEGQPVAFKESQEFKDMSEKIVQLERKDRVNHYKAETASLNIQGTADELAEKLVNIEFSAGEETATELLEAWKRESEATMKFTQATGRREDVVDETEYDFEAQAKARAEKDGIAYEVALSRLSLEKPREFNAYREQKASV